MKSQSIFLIGKSLLRSGSFLLILILAIAAGVAGARSMSAGYQAAYSILWLRLSEKPHLVYQIDRSDQYGFCNSSDPEEGIILWKETKKSVAYEFLEDKRIESWGTIVYIGMSTFDAGEQPVNVIFSIASTNDLNAAGERNIGNTTMVIYYNGDKSLAEYLAKSLDIKNALLVKSQTLLTKNKGPIALVVVNPSSSNITGILERLSPYLEGHMDCFVRVYVNLDINYFFKSTGRIDRDIKLLVSNIVSISEEISTSLEATSRYLDYRFPPNPIPREEENQTHPAIAQVSVADLRLAKAISESTILVARGGQELAPIVVIGMTPILYTLFYTSQWLSRELFLLVLFIEVRSPGSYRSNEINRVIVSVAAVTAGLAGLFFGTFTDGLFAAIIVALTSWIGLKQGRSMPRWVISILTALMIIYVSLTMSGLGILDAFRINPTLGSVLAILHSLRPLYPFIIAYIIEITMHYILSMFERVSSRNLELRAILRTYSERPQLIISAALSSSLVALGWIISNIGSHQASLLEATSYATLRWLQPLMAVFSASLILFIMFETYQYYRQMYSFTIIRAGRRPSLTPIAGSTFLAFTIAFIPSLVGFYILLKAPIEALSGFLIHL